jgi:hypothetical protein
MTPSDVAALSTRKASKSTRRELLNTMRAYKVKG